MTEREYGTFAADVLETGRVQFDAPQAVLAYCRTKFAGQRIDVEFAPRKSKRSLRANAALHAGLFEWAAYRQLVGEAAKQFVEDAKDDLLKMCFGVVVRQSPLTGEVVTRLVKPHTSHLTVEDFTELFDVALVEAAKDGHVWRLPEEFTKERRTAAQKGRAA